LVIGAEGVFERSARIDVARRAKLGSNGVERHSFDMQKAAPVGEGCHEGAYFWLGWVDCGDAGESGRYRLPFLPQPVNVKKAANKALINRKFRMSKPLKSKRV
jgi:hypothetical protein